MNKEIPKDPNTQRPKNVDARIARLRFGYLGVWVLGYLTFLGCGPSKPDTIPVTGEVIYNGQPVEGANVVFASEGPPATGLTDAQGKFTLRTFADGDGAIAGSHRVTVTKNVSGPSTPENPYPESKNMLPAQYARPDSSQLTAEVGPDKENVFRLELKD